MIEWILIIWVGCANVDCGTNQERNIGTFDTRAGCWNAAIWSALDVRTRYLGTINVPDYKYRWRCVEFASEETKK